VAGTLQLAQGSFIDYGVGAFVMVVGTLYILVGRQTALKLKNLHASIYSEDTLRAKFQEADTDSKGALTIVQLKTCLASLGVTLNTREAEAALDHMDKDVSGTLTYAEFRTWWEEWAHEDTMRNNIV
jgi:hypothetical protein